MHGGRQTVAVGYHLFGQPVESGGPSDDAVTPIVSRVPTGNDVTDDLVEAEVQRDFAIGGGGAIAVLALFLAFSETLGKSAQTAALNSQIEASNLWNFFQAVRSRQPVVQNAVFGHHAAAACHMANQAYFRKATVTWDAANDTIRG